MGASLKRIRYRHRSDDLLVPGAVDGIQPAEDANLHARVDEIADVSLVSFSRELNALRARHVAVRIKPTRDRYLLIEIPVQPAETLPVLVRRARLAGGLSEEQVTIPERVGDETTFWDGARLHSLLVAGRSVFATERELDGRPPTAHRPEGPRYVR